MNFKLCLVLLFFFYCVCSGNKYSEDTNKKKDDPFKMQKVNLVWHKAQMKIKNKDQLSELYQDLKLHDQFECDVKKRKATGEDPDGEFEAMVRSRFLDLMMKYSLEGMHPDVNPRNDNNIKYDKPPHADKWERVMADKRLNKLWRNAQSSGFTEKELAALKAEFMHHADKVEELNILQSSLKKEGLNANSVDTLKDDQNVASLREERENHVNMKRKYRELRDNLEQLEQKVVREKSINEKTAGGFNHPKVIDLWFNAKSANFTEEELESVQEELLHFEHKLKKLEYLHTEHESIVNRAKDQNMKLGTFPEKQVKVEEKVKDYTKKKKVPTATLR